jgi:hypothetical protein
VAVHGAAAEAAAAGPEGLIGLLIFAGSPEARARLSACVDAVCVAAAAWGKDADKEHEAKEDPVPLKWDTVRPPTLHTRSTRVALNVANGADRCSVTSSGHTTHADAAPPSTPTARRPPAARGCRRARSRPTLPRCAAAAAAAAAAARPVFLAPHNLSTSARLFLIFVCGRGRWRYGSVGGALASCWPSR